MNDIRTLKETIKILAGLLSDAEQRADSLESEVNRLYPVQLNYSRRTSDAYNIIKDSESIRMNKETREKLLKLLDFKGGI